MSEENVEIVRELIELLQRPQAAPRRVLELVDPHVVIINVASAPETRPFVGYEGMGQWLATYASEFRNLEIRLREIVDAGGDHVIALTTIEAVGDKSGLPFALDLASIVTLLNGKVVRVAAFATREEACAAAGLPVSD